MSVRDIFDSEVPDGDADPQYITLRDLQHRFGDEARALVRRIWERFNAEGLAEPGFRKNFARRMLDRYWEMHLACALLEHGIVIKRQPRDGPDFYAEHEGRRVWFEAKVVEGGSGPDAVPPIEHSGVVQDGPVRARIRRALMEKRGRWKAFLKRGDVSADDFYVLGLNLKLTNYWWMSDPTILELALFGAAPRWTFNFQQETVTESFADASTIRGTSGAPLDMKPFRDPRYSWLTSVIGSGVDPWNVWHGISGDFQVVNNPMARPLKPGYLPHESADLPQSAAVEPPPQSS